MLIKMKEQASPESIASVLKTIGQKGFKARIVDCGIQKAIAVLDNDKTLNAGHFNTLPEIECIIHSTRPYKLAGREFKSENTIIRVGDIAIGDGSLTLMAGPCAIENEYQALTIAESVKKAGASFFRGGAFKPRTSPYSFQGLGKLGLKILAKVRESTGLRIVTEAMDEETFAMVEEYADIVQIGTRNMQNFALLRLAGKSTKPILLKRGMAATVDEWLMAAEYILEGGNTNVLLCERGVRTFVNHSRNTLDISAIPVVQKESHLPLIIDPSHAAGVRDQVVPLSLAATAAGADGLLIEVHHQPENALSDGAQSLYPYQFEQLNNKLQSLRKLLTGNGIETQNEHNHTPGKTGEIDTASGRAA